ncbi:MAG: hypothetical protein IJ830_05860 [Alphaproteobacteria bacterium]|nr:hypothetical protein [Alphaproteobacteria bacterium]
MVTNPIDIRSYDTLSDFYKEVKNIIKGEPERIAECIELIKIARAENKTADDLRAFYKILYYMADHTVESYYNDKVVEKYFKEHDEIKKLAAEFAFDAILEDMDKAKYVEPRPGEEALLREMYKINEKLLQSGSISEEKALEFLRAGFANNNPPMDISLSILNIISEKPEYVDECIRLTAFVREGFGSWPYGMLEDKADFLYQLMKKYPEKKDKCLPILLEILPTSYEKSQELSSADSSERRLRKRRKPITEAADKESQELSSADLSGQQLEKRKNSASGYELVDIVPKVLEVAPETFASCLPAMRKIVNEMDGSSYSTVGYMNTIIDLSKQFMRLYPTQNAELVILGAERFESQTYAENTKFADNVLEATEKLIETEPTLDEELQQKLIDIIWKASEGKNDKEDDLVVRHLELYSKMMSSEAFSKKTKISILEKVLSNGCFLDDEEVWISENEVALFKQVLEEKICSEEYVIKILTKLNDNEHYDNIAKIAQQNYGENTEVKNVLKTLDKERRNRKIIDDVLNEAPAGSKTEAFIRLADAVIQTRDEENINQFKKLLFSRGEEAVFRVDKQAMTWFVNNGDETALEALNNLRQIYGLKTELSEYWHIDPNINDAKRIRFEGAYSAIGKLQYDRETGDLVNNPHYVRKLSDAYLGFKPDYSRDFKPKEYDLHQNEAYNTFVSEGVKMPIKKLQEAFSKLHMPPETAQKLNGTDLQHVLVTYTNWYDEQKNNYMWQEDERCDDELNKSLFEAMHAEDEGYHIPMRGFSSKAPVSIRSKKWKAFAHNKELVEFVSKDLRRYDIDELTIKRFWENARNHGSPCYDKYGNVSFYGLRSSLHHGEPLRQGGTNEQSTIITLNIRKACYVERTDWEGDTYTRWQEGGNMEVHSHDPFHFFDNPCVHLYQRLSDGKLTIKDEESGVMKKRMMIITRPSAECKEGEQVVYYGGPRECSCAIMDKEGHVRQASYDFWKREGFEREKLHTQPSQNNTKER